MNFACRTHRRHRFTAALGLGLLLTVLAVNPGFAANGDTASDRPPAERIDLNRATVEQLQTIPGIGPSLAQRILDFRSEHGPFLRVEDLLKVKGIGEKSLQKIRSFVVVEAQT